MFQFLSYYLKQKLFTIFIIFSLKCNTDAQNFYARGLISQLFNRGQASDGIGYSFIVNPVVAAKPKIKLTELEFENDYYPGQIEAEIKWINDKQRLEEQNVANNAGVGNEPEYTERAKGNVKEVSESYEDNGDNEESDQSNDSEDDYGSDEQNMDKESNESNDRNKEKNIKNALNLNHLKAIQTENIEPKHTENIESNHLKEIIAKPMNSFVEKKPIEIQTKGMPEMKIQYNSEVNEMQSKPESQSQWKRIEGKDGKNIEQRVIELPQTFDLPQGFREVGDKEIITDPNEVVITENLEPIVSEEILDLPDNQF